jgi:hypothetical protein
MSTDTTPVVDVLARAKAGELLGPLDLMAIFHLKPSRFYELKVRGAFDRFLVDRPITGRAAYSGVRVYRYVTAEDEQPTFGRKRGAR